MAMTGLVTARIISGTPPTCWAQGPRRVARCWTGVLCSGENWLGRPAYGAGRQRGSRPRARKRVQRLMRLISEDTVARILFPHAFQTRRPLALGAARRQDRG